MRASSRFSFCVSLAVCAFVLAWAETALAQQAGVVDLGTVTVSAGRGTPVDKMDVSTTVISREQIQNSPELTVDQILNKVPGIFISDQPFNQLHPTGQELSMRGFGNATNELVLVLVDGVPINDPYFRTINWSQIPKETIDRIEIIRGGGATSLWGNMAMGGVINIITRAPAPGEKRIAVSGGSFGTGNVSASTGAAVNDSVRIGLTYDGMKTDGYNQTPGPFQGVTAGGVSTMGPTHSLTDNVTASAYFTPNAQSNYYMRLTANGMNEDGLIYDMANNYWRTYRIVAGGSTEFLPKTTINSMIWYQYNQFGTQNVAENARLSPYAVNAASASPNTSVPFVSLIENANYATLGASEFVQSARGDLTDFKIGLDYRQVWLLGDNGEAFRTNAACPVGNSLVCQGGLSASASHQFEGLFAQATYRPNPIPLDITVGLREDFWQATSGSVSAITNAATAAGVVNLAQALADQSYVHFDPRIGLKYDLGYGFDIRGAAYENFSAPGLNQMYRTFLTSSFTMANPNLVPQTNTGGEVGMDFKSAKFDVGFTVFRNQVQNYIDFVPGITCNGTIYQPLCAALEVSHPATNGLRQYQNVGNALMQGFETMGTWRATDKLTLNAGFTYTDAHLTSATAAAAGQLDPVNSQLGQVPPWIVTLGATWAVTDKLTLTVVGKDFSDFWQYTNHAYQQTNQGAFTADILVKYKMYNNFEMFASIQNIGNVQYYDQGAILGAQGVPPQLAMPLNWTLGCRLTF